VHNYDYPTRRSQCTASVQTLDNSYQIITPQGDMKPRRRPNTNFRFENKIILISPFLWIFDKLIRFQFLVFSSPLLQITLMVGRFHPFHRPRRPLWRVEIYTLFLDLGTRRGWGVSVTPRPLSTPEKDPVPIVQEAEWAPGPVWTGAEYLAPTLLRSPDRQARSQSLHRLSYPTHINDISALHYI
jgi:hypothetical protein